jgi:hypothetical protein
VVYWVINRIIARAEHRCSTASETNGPTSVTANSENAREIHQFLHRLITKGDEGKIGLRVYGRNVMALVYASRDAESAPDLVLADTEDMRLRANNLMKSIHSLGRSQDGDEMVESSIPEKKAMTGLDF